MALEIFYHTLTKPFWGNKRLKTRSSLKWKISGKSLFKKILLAKSGSFLLLDLREKRSFWASRSINFIKKREKKLKQWTKYAKNQNKWISKTTNLNTWNIFCLKLRPFSLFWSLLSLYMKKIIIVNNNISITLFVDSPKDPKIDSSAALCHDVMTEGVLRCNGTNFRIFRSCCMTFSNSVLAWNLERKPAW